jgi:hypothetical protein
MTMAARVLGTTEALFHVGGPLGPKISIFAGNPSGQVLGNPGDLVIDPTGGAGLTLWVKESGLGTADGWAAK